MSPDFVFLYLEDFFFDLEEFFEFHLEEKVTRPLHPAKLQLKQKEQRKLVHHSQV